MIETITKTRKWGNSIGISLPKEIVKKAKIKPNTNLKIFISENSDKREKIFGSLNFKEQTQKILDKVRR